jgi:hypothetical protein
MTALKPDRLLKACDLYARTSRGTGQREYLVGYLGGVKVLIFKVHDPQADGPSHTMFYAERKPRPERPTRDAERGQAIHDAMRDIAEGWTREQRDAHVQELAARFLRTMTRASGSPSQRRNRRHHDRHV